VAIPSSHRSGEAFAALVKAALELAAPSPRLMRGLQLKRRLQNSFLINLRVIAPTRRTIDVPDVTDQRDQEAAKIRAVLRETFGQELDEQTARDIADRVSRPVPILHQRKEFPGRKR